MLNGCSCLWHCWRPSAESTALLWLLCTRTSYHRSLNSFALHCFKVCYKCHSFKICLIATVTAFVWEYFSASKTFLASGQDQGHVKQIFSKGHFICSLMVCSTLSSLNKCVHRASEWEFLILNGTLVHKRPVHGVTMVIAAEWLHQ